MYDSASMTLEQVIEVMKDTEARGGMTVRLHTGDPSLYGAIREQMDELDKLGIGYDVTPGVSSTMERRFPMSLLNSMDLPTLGRPTMATMGFTSRALPFLIQSYLQTYSVILYPLIGGMASHPPIFNAAQAQKKGGKICSSLPIHRTLLISPPRT